VLDRDDTTVYFLKEVRYRYTQPPFASSGGESSLDLELVVTRGAREEGRSFLGIRMGVLLRCLLLLGTMRRGNEGDDRYCD